MNRRRGRLSDLGNRDVDFPGVQPSKTVAEIYSTVDGPIAYELRGFHGLSSKQLDTRSRRVPAPRCSTIRNTAYNQGIPEGPLRPNPQLGYSQQCTREYLSLFGCVVCRALQLTTCPSLFN